MAKISNRRRIKKRKRGIEKTKMKFTSVIVIMLLAIALGYLTARFILGPLLGYNADESQIQVEQEAKANEEEQEQQASAAEEGYALQFGVFSTREAANKLVESLSQKGVQAKIIEENQQFKVISPIINTKEEALNTLNEIKDKEVEDVFITSF